jgi:hypothetical protein
MVEEYRRYGFALRDVAVAAVPQWLRSAFIARLGGDSALDDRFDRMVAQVQAEMEQRLTALAAADIDQPISGPLELIRQSAGSATELLLELGASPLPRDAAVAAMYPADVFEIGPAAAIALGQDVHEASIAWGAAKAYLHLNRHRD